MPGGVDPFRLIGGAVGVLSLLLVSTTTISSQNLRLSSAGTSCFSAFKVIKTADKAMGLLAGLFKFIVPWLTRFRMIARFCLQ